MLTLDDAQKQVIAGIVTDTWQRLGQAIGVISEEDARFLLGVIAQADARRVIEVGVAAGSSSTAILSLFAALGGDRTLFSFDLLESFYGDTDKPLGFLALEDPVASGQEYHVFGGALSADVGSTLDASGFGGMTADVAFIDAHHCHPWAALDTLCVLPHVRPDAWIVLHDTNLTKLAGHGAEFGPRVLFDAYTGEKMESDAPEIPNIGALKLSGDPEEVRSIIRSLDVPWEFAPQHDFLERICDTVSKHLDAKDLGLFDEILVARSGFQRVAA